MTRLLKAILMFPLTGKPEPIDWNARLAATLKPQPEYLKRRQAGKLGWSRRRIG